MSPTNRIQIDPAVCHGKPFIQGTRVPVSIVVGSLATALILFGYSLFYGAVGRLDFASLAAFAAAHPDDKLLIGGALIVTAAVLAGRERAT